MSFIKYVGIGTITRARFNYWEPSFSRSGLNYLATTYYTHISEANLNLSVIEVTQRSRESKGRTEWYFGTFQGKRSRECQGEEVEEFFDQLYDIVTRRNRIAGRNLERSINQ